MKVYIGPFKKNSDERKIDVRIDKYDTWNMESTLAYIVLPMLKQLKATTHGSPGDMIEFQQTSNSAQYSFDFYEEFEQINTDWEAQFHSGEHDFYFEEINDYCIMKHGPNDTHKFDSEGYFKFQNCMQEGFELFGKYYRNLWD